MLIDLELGRGNKVIAFQSIETPGEVIRVPPIVVLQEGDVVETIRRRVDPGIQGAGLRAGPAPRPDDIAPLGKRRGDVRIGIDADDEGEPGASFRNGGLGERAGDRPVDEICVGLCPDGDPLKTGRRDHPDRRRLRHRELFPYNSTFRGLDYICSIYR